MCFSRDLFFFLGKINCRRGMQFWPPYRTFSQELRTIFDWNSKVTKTVNFIPKHQKFLELLLRTCRMQFWQPCMKLAEKVRKIDDQFLKKNLCVIQEICSSFSEGSYVDVKGSFEHRAETFPQELRTYFD